MERGLFMQLVELPRSSLLLTSRVTDQELWEPVPLRVAAPFPRIAAVLAPVLLPMPSCDPQAAFRFRQQVETLQAAERDRQF